MKKLIAMVCMTVLCMSVLTACGSKGKQSEEAKDKQEQNANKISVVTTIFPEYDWVKEITKGNDNVDVTMLLDKGVDLHSYQPTAEDLLKVSTCDVFVYVGGESDQWVEDALATATNKDMVVVNLMDVMGDNAKEEAIVEGMESEEEEEEEGEEEGPEYDEHVWLSVKNAEIISQYLAKQFSKIDSSNKDLYEKNVKAYCTKLDGLDKKYQEAVSNGTVHTLVFGDRFPFRYLVDDYQLAYYAAFVGCSAESEASFETITFLANKVDELQLHSILQIESADGKIAETVKENTKDKNQKILTLDSMQSVTAQDVADGETYLKVMEKNLQVLQEVLENAE